MLGVNHPYQHFIGFCIPFVVLINESRDLRFDTNHGFIILFVLVIKPTLRKSSSLQLS